MRIPTGALLVSGVIGAVFALAIAACGDRGLKGAGETCVASTDCDDGLVCDLNRSPPVCAQMSSPPPPPGVDAADDVDAAADAAIDARPDAPPDAAPDAPDAM